MRIEKVVLSADLSLSCPAFAVVKIVADKDGEIIEILHVSHVKTSTKKGLGFRLWEIHDHVKAILKTHEIDMVVMEKGFSRFHTVTHQLQRVVGVFILTCHMYGVSSIDEITPTSVKKAITGDGKASKAFLAESLSKYLPSTEYATDDESDAVGVAIALMKKEGWLL